MKFTEILRLKKMLEEANIPFQFSENFNGGFHIVYSFEGEEVCSVVEHEFSYGREKDLLDVKNWFERHSQSLKWCKMYNSKNIEMILSAISRNAEAFQEFGDDTAVFFKCDPKNKNKITEVFVKRECEDEIRAADNRNP